MILVKQTWVDVEKYLKTKNTLLLPIGSTEQHGPTGLLGTDFMTADAVAREVGEKLELMVAPPLCYGMAAHHMGFAGSATLSPTLYMAVICELLRSYYQHGFRQFHLVNGHGGNQHCVRAAFQQVKAEGMTGASFSLYNWWVLPEVEALAKELYGKEEGFHATPSEISLTYYLENIAPRTLDADTSRQMPASWPLTAEEVKKVFPTGAMESNPSLARAEHGKRFLDTAVESIISSIRKSSGRDE